MRVTARDLAEARGTAGEPRQLSGVGGASTLAPVTPPLGIHALCYPGPRCLPRCGRSDSMSLPRFGCKNLWPEQTQFNPKQSEAVN